MSAVVFKAILTSKALVQDPVEGEGVKLELAQEKSIPPPMILSRSEESEIAREVAPIVQQVVRSMPFAPRGKIRVPRLTLWLTREEWDRLEPKPDIGDEVEVRVLGTSVEVMKA
ncbi:MAG: arcadin 1 [Candidatus Bathyarchaeia archaeon]